MELNKGEIIELLRTLIKTVEGADKIVNFHFEGNNEIVEVCPDRGARCAIYKQFEQTGSSDINISMTIYNTPMKTT
jgi:hypothetical protein